MIRLWNKMTNKILLTFTDLKYHKFILFSILIFLSSCKKENFELHENPAEMGGWEQPVTLWQSGNLFFFKYDPEDFLLGPYRDETLYILYNQKLQKHYKLNYSNYQYSNLNIVSDTIVLSNSNWNNKDRWININLKRQKLKTISNNNDEFSYWYSDSTGQVRKIGLYNLNDIELIEQAQSESKNVLKFINTIGDTCIKFKVPAFKYDKNFKKIDLKKVESILNSY
jgi:hypothetical protein